MPDTTMKNDRICPEDTLRVLLPADKIPDCSTVYKPTGTKPHALRRNLTIYQYGNKVDPVVISGYFLVDDNGGITQIQPDHMLHWSISAESFVDELRQSWDVETGAG